MDTTSEAHEVNWMAKGTSKDSGIPVKPPPPGAIPPSTDTALPTTPAAPQVATAPASSTITPVASVSDLKSVVSTIDSAQPPIAAPADSTALPTPKTSTPQRSNSPPMAVPASQPAATVPATGAVNGSAAPSPTISRTNSRRSSVTRSSSWLTSISSKFSSKEGSKEGASNNTATTNSTATPTQIKATNKGVGILPAATRPEGEAPYVPAPVKSPQTGGIRGVFRRLSQSGPFANIKSNSGNHGMVERRVLNVDPNRERCAIAELQPAKLRRVAFLVDVEIAPMPKYKESEPAGAGDKTLAPAVNATKQNLSDKAEGEAFKKAKAAAAVSEGGDKGPTKLATVLESPANGKPRINEPLADKPTNGTTPVAPETASATPQQNGNGTGNAADIKLDANGKPKPKRTPEEREARRERRRLLAENNGQIPMELHLDVEEQASEVLSPMSPSTAATSPAGLLSPGALSPTPSQGLPTSPSRTPNPTTNPVRIYRRCCQLRETPILKRITEQLLNPANLDATTGAVEKLDFTNFHLQGPDFVTLGDYFAVVPVKEVNFENSGLDDASLRVVLAGLLAARLRNTRRRRNQAKQQPTGEPAHGGFVETLHLSYNKFGLEGWKHLALFVNMCRSLRQLDVSHLDFPKPIYEPGPTGDDVPRVLAKNDAASLLQRAITKRLAGGTLELLNVGATYMAPEQLGLLVDGALHCRIKRLSLANMKMNAMHIPHVKRWLASPVCEGLDLGSNDLKDHIDDIMSVLNPESGLGALSLANCHLEPKSLSVVFPALAQLKELRFLDLSSNTELFAQDGSASNIIRRYLPQFNALRRIHLSNVSMKPDEAIMIAEIIPEVRTLAHISLLNNADLQALADARTESAQEEACGMYASLLAAARISKSLVCIDIDIPTENSSDIVKALAQQVVAYCLRNLAHVSMDGDEIAPDVKNVPNPEVLAHLVGHHEHDDHSESGDHSEAPDDDYVIGGTGVVKALQACLNSHIQDSEVADNASGSVSDMSDETKTNAARARDVTKHLLSSARKILARLKPALERAENSHSEDVRRLRFLNDTLNGIIERFETEFPETRPAKATPIETAATKPREVEPSEVGLPASPTLEPADGVPSDGEDDMAVHIPGTLSRTSSMIFHESKAQAAQEGRAHRTGHQFRFGMMRKEMYDMFLTSLDEIGNDTEHVRLLHQMVGDIEDPVVDAKVREKGVVQTFKEERALIAQRLYELDPEHWSRFIESQEKARANVSVEEGGRGVMAAGLLGFELGRALSRDSAVSDDAVSGEE